MDGRQKFLAAAVLVLLGTCGVAAPALGAAMPRVDSGASSSPFASTSSGIGLGLAFDYNAHDLSAVSNNVSYVFGGLFLDWDFGFYPPSTHLDGYIPFDNDPYPQTVPGHSLSDWQQSHPDWIVYQCDGKTPAYYGSGNTNVPLDFSNPAVRAWQLQQAGTLFQNGAAGISFDDFQFANFENRCGVYRNGQWTPLGYPGLWKDNAQYTNDMLGWLQDIRSQLQAQYPGKTLTVNFAPSVSGLSNLQRIAPYIDMDFDEAGFTDFGQHRLSGAAWQEEVDALEYLNSLGKAFFVNGIVGAVDDPSVTSDQINWVLANYLLVRGSSSYTYVYAGNGAGFTGSPSGYGTFFDRPEYHVPIGYPTSARFWFHGVQARSYSGGLALVNPSASTTYYVPLGREYSDMYGKQYNSVALPPTTGIVLLGGGAPEPIPLVSSSHRHPVRKRPKQARCMVNRPRHGRGSRRERRRYQVCRRRGRPARRSGRRRV